MKHTLRIVLVIILFLTLSGCQSCARSFGGNVTIDIPAGEKLETASWNGNAVDYQTRKRRDGEQPETHYLRESSNLGIAQSVVTFIER